MRERERQRERGVGLSHLNIGLNSSTALNISLPPLQKCRRGSQGRKRERFGERDEEEEGGPQGVHQYKGDIVKNRQLKKGRKEGEGKRKDGGGKNLIPLPPLLCKIRMKYF